MKEGAPADTKFLPMSNGIRARTRHLYALYETRCICSNGVGSNLCNSIAILETGLTDGHMFVVQGAYSTSCQLIQCMHLGLV